jgi:uncharacterized protein (TIGR02118 family)
MIKVSVLYPSAVDKTFDMNCYCAKHMPMAQALIGSACKKIGVELGLSGGAPGSAPIMQQLAICFLKAWRILFPQHMDALRADIPNYTNITSIIQISEVKI